MEFGFQFAVNFFLAIVLNLLIYWIIPCIYCLIMKMQADNQLYQGNVEYGMDVLLGQPDNGLNSNQDMERGRSAADNW